MKRQGVRTEIITVLLIIFLISFVSATFNENNIGNLSHQLTKKIYGPGEKIKGWINISLSNEPTNSIFKDSEENTISLIDLLKVQDNYDYACNILGCSSDYTSSNEQLTKTFNLVANKSKIIGIKIIGKLTNINSASFNVESDASTSCTNQLIINLFNDNSKLIKNNKSSNEYCSSKNYGCFDEGESTIEGEIGITPYCQKIKISETPGIKIGAWVKKYSGSQNLKMGLYDGSNEVVNCDLPDASSEGGEISCGVNYLITEPKDYYVCIYSASGSGTDKVKGYSSSEGCGFNGFPIKSETASYKIFAQLKKFGAVNTLGVTNIENLIENYISSKYRGFDCSDMCIVPIKITAKTNQEITLKDLLINYDKEGFSGTEEKNLYDLTETPARVSADFQKLFLDKGNFSAGTDYGNDTFSLKLGNTEIFSEKIIIEKIPIINFITPLTTASAFPTTFSVDINSSKNITKYKWEFGDNETETTSVNKVTHTYTSTGTYEFKITVTDSDDREAFKIFSISVSTPEQEINKTLKKKLEDLTNINAQIKEFDIFSQDGLNLILNIDLLDEELKELQKDFTQASSEENYNEIMTNLLGLKVPESIITTTSADSVIFYPDERSMNLNILQEIGGGDYNSSDENKYFDAIFIWNQEDLDTKITFNEISAQYESHEEAILRVFEVKMNEKNTLSTKPYFILKKLDNLEFKRDYKQKEKLGYVYIELENPQEIIMFSTTEDIDFINVPLFISPGINELSISREVPQKEKKTSKWIIFSLIIIVVIIVGFIVYVILQQWYKKKYEEYLFKNRNNLFNLITYIENTKRKGLTNKEIESKLKKAGWNSEQIRYSMRKHAGKRTGMIELPIKFKKKKQDILNQRIPKRHNPRRRF